MPTTVQVQEKTRRLLDKIKREMGVSSYDAVINKLMRTRGGMTQSLFGACKGSRPFTREEAEHDI